MAVHLTVSNIRDLLMQIYETDLKDIEMTCRVQSVDMQTDRRDANCWSVLDNLIWISTWKSSMHPSRSAQTYKFDLLNCMVKESGDKRLLTSLAVAFESN